VGAMGRRPRRREKLDRAVTVGPSFVCWACTLRCIRHCHLYITICLFHFSRRYNSSLITRKKSILPARNCYPDDPLNALSLSAADKSSSIDFTCVLRSAVISKSPAYLTAPSALSILIAPRPVEAVPGFRRNMRSAWFRDPACVTSKGEPTRPRKVKASRKTDCDMLRKG
jgi:hypothetical protein